MQRILLLAVLLFLIAVAASAQSSDVFSLTPLPDCATLVGPCSSDPIEGGPFDTSYGGKFYKYPPP